MIAMIMIITYSNYKFNGKYWAIFGTKMSTPPGGPDYRGTAAV